MDSIGEKLRQARESKKLSIHDVAKETNISSSYIEALEDEDFDRFPGETYVVGFLRNYSEFLKLDADDFIQSYKGYKIGESATPLEELTRPTKAFTGFDFSNLVQKKSVLMVGGGIIVLVLVILLAKMGASGSVDTSGDDTISNIQNEYNKNNEKSEFEKMTSLKLQNDKGMIIVSIKEAIQFLAGNKECLFVLKEVKGNTINIFTLPDKKTATLNVDQPVKLAFSASPREVTVTLKALTENRAKLLIEVAPDANASATNETNTSEDTSVNNAVSGQTRVTVQDPNNLKIVFDAEFIDRSYIELYLDGQQRATGMVQPGRKERWEANSTIQIKIGNAGGIKARINGKDFVFGAKGQVANKVIKWEKDPANPSVYNLTFKDWK